MKKLLSSPAIQFKGIGLYITDYAQQGSRDSKDQQGPRARELVLLDVGNETGIEDRNEDAKPRRKRKTETKTEASE